MRRFPSTSEHQHARSAPPIEPITMRIRDASRYTGISRSTLYLLIAKGQIEVVKLGSSTLVVTESLKQLIAKRRHSAIDPTVGREHAS